MYSKFAGNNSELKPYHHMRLDSEFKEDCRVWLSFLKGGFGTANIFRPMVDLSAKLQVEELNFYSDASGSLKRGGFGCVYHREWAWGRWSEDFMGNCNLSIEYLELGALVISIFIWSEKIKNKHFIVFCDNEAVVNMVNNFTSSCRNCRVLVRKLMTRCLDFNFRIITKHVKTSENGIADFLSRQDWGHFKE